MVHFISSRSLTVDSSLRRLQFKPLHVLRKMCRQSGGDEQVAPICPFRQHNRLGVEVHRDVSDFGLTYPEHLQHLWVQFLQHIHTCSQ